MMPLLIIYKVQTSFGSEKYFKIERGLPNKFRSTFFSLLIHFYTKIDRTSGPRNPHWKKVKLNSCFFCGTRSKNKFSNRMNQNLTSIRFSSNSYTKEKYPNLHKYSFELEGHSTLFFSHHQIPFIFMSCNFSQPVTHRWIIHGKTTHKPGAEMGGNGTLWNTTQVYGGHY